MARDAILPRSGCKASVSVFRIEKGATLSNPSTLNDLVRQADQLLNAGKISEATAIIQEAYKLDKNNVDVLVLVAQVAPGDDQRRNALKRVLETDPSHAKARALLARLEGTPAIAKAALTATPTIPAQKPPQVDNLAKPSNVVPQPTAVTQAGRVSPVFVVIPAALIVFAGIAFLLLRGSGRPTTPDGLVLRFFDALQSQDNGAFESLMSPRARQATSFGCPSGSMATCLVNYLKLENVQSKAALVKSSSATNAQVMLKMNGTVASRQGEYCQSYEVVKNSQGWEIDKFENFYGCEGSQVATVAPSVAQNPTVVSTNVPVGTVLPTPTVEPTTRALLQTATNIAATRLALLEGPTLTATALAPAFTQTAAAFAPLATQTKIAQDQTQLAVVLGVTQTVASGWATGTAQRLAPTQTVQARNAVTNALPGQLIYSNRGFHAFDKTSGSNQDLPIGGGSLAVSPDGQRIAYDQQSGSQNFIWLSEINGSNQIEITKKFRAEIKPDDTRFFNPVWSPDSKQIAFTGLNPARSSSHLYTLAVDGTTWKQLTPDQGIAETPYWSPDGRQIIFVKQKMLWIINADGTGARALNIGGEQPAWSPDGKNIAYTIVESDMRVLYLINPDGTGKRRIDLGANEAAWPLWSPDGKFLAFNFYESQSRKGQLRILILATSQTIVVIPDYDFYASRIGWGP